jgi:hypothetical protein
MTFDGTIVAQANDIHALSKREPISFADMLRIARQIKAIDLLKSIGSDDLSMKLRQQTIEEPDPTWLNAFCE